MIFQVPYSYKYNAASSAPFCRRRSSFQWLLERWLGEPSGRKYILFVSLDRTVLYRRMVIQGNTDTLHTMMIWLGKGWAGNDKMTLVENKIPNEVHHLSDSAKQIMIRLMTNFIRIYKKKSSSPIDILRWNIFTFVLKWENWYTIVTVGQKGCNRDPLVRHQLCQHCRIFYGIFCMETTS